MIKIDLIIKNNVAGYPISLGYLNQRFIFTKLKLFCLLSQNQAANFYSTYDYALKINFIISIMICLILIGIIYFSYFFFIDSLIKFKVFNLYVIYHISLFFELLLSLGQIFNAIPFDLFSVKRNCVFAISSFLVIFIHYVRSLMG